MLSKEILLISLLNLLILWPMIKLHVTSVISDLKPLLETQKSMIEEIKYILKNKQKTFEMIEKKLKKFKTEQENAAKSPRLYFGNPINALMFMMRLTIDLEQIEAAIMKTPDLPRNKSLVYTSKEDLTNAVLGLHRLQKVYKLNVTQLVDGILNTTFSARGQTHLENMLPLTTFDCYDIGVAMCQRKLCKYGILWLLEAYRVLGRSSVTLGLDKVDILWEISKGYHTLDDHENYVEWTEKLKKYKPKNTVDLDIYMDVHKLKVTQNKFIEMTETEQLREKMRKMSVNHERYKLKRKPPIDPNKETKNCAHGTLSKAYKMLCRGEINVGSFVAKRLRCWYSRYNHFTKLAPIKTEQLFVKPDIFLFHNVIHDDEIERIKDFVLIRLKVSKIMVKNKKSQPSIYRVSKGCHVEDQEQEMMKVLTQRIADLSGLNTTSSEPYHVNNYGVWGYYTHHLDYWQDPAQIERMGNRMATALLYLSEVKQGGATIFPSLGLTVFPVKGAVLYWHNLLPTGEGNIVTCHGSCPVLRGEKWSATKWINSRYQEMAKPCTTKFQSRKPQDIPYPEFKAARI